MTLVLPFGVDQIASAPLFSGPGGSSQNSSMPCVFDNDAFDRDFESALMRDWATDITDYSLPAEDSPVKTPSESNDLKRKAPACNDEESDSLSSAKKARFEDDSRDPVVPSTEAASPETAASDSSFDSGLIDSSSSTSGGSSSSEGGSTEEEEEYLPRRRSVQMWNSRQRWKDERKKVLKMSISKLAEIEDPELCLLRSVLINNTIKRLHSDIKNERQVKIRQRVMQHRTNFYESSPSEEQQHPFFPSSSASTTVAKPDFYDDSSCDEIFGMGEDLWRVEVQDRRVSSPVPRTSPEPASDSSCDNTPNPSPQQTVVTTAPVAPQPRKPVALPPPSTTPSPGGGQCAMQYSRTNRDLRGGFGDVSFPPRVPILDSVVYHSLLASLESS